MSITEIVNMIGAAVALWFALRKGKPVPQVLGGGIQITDVLDQVRKFVEALQIPHDQKAVLAKDLVHALTAPQSSTNVAGLNPGTFVPSRQNSGP